MDRSPQQQKIHRIVHPGVLEEGQTIGQRYRVVRRIGGGAFGTVYEVEHLALGKRFALKVLNATSSSNQRTISRFRAEAITASRIEHPNIVSVTDFGRTKEGLAYYVMELLHGETLSEVLRRERVLRLSRAIPILAATSHGLEAAHQAGVIHRDLKPENIFLVPDEQPHLGLKRELVRILDFGLAKVLEAPSFTMDGITYGTPGYMAPEQIRGEVVDQTADIYSIGCIAFEMFAGHALFRGTALEVALAHCEQEPPELQNSPSPRIKALIERCLRKDPKERFTSCKEILVDLRALAVEFLTPDGRTKAGVLDVRQLERTSRESLTSVTRDDSNVDTWWEEFSSIARRLDEDTTFSSVKTQVSDSTSDATLVDHEERETDPMVVDQPHVKRWRQTGYYPFETTVQAAPAPFGGRAGWVAVVVGLLTVLLLLATVIYQLLAFKKSGSLVLDLEPEAASVMVNGEQRPGEGRVRVYDRLSGGEALIRVSHQGCDTQQQVVSVEPGRSRVLQIKLRCR